MSKQIVFCADGTWNGPGARAEDDIDGDAQADVETRDNVTNVVKLFANLAGQVTAETQALQNEAEKVLKGAAGDTVQIAKYMHGVGDSRNALVKALGGVLGAGVIGRIVRGYTFISRVYERGDSIHIVGFSRGAYTARALAGMIGGVGLLNSAKYDPADKSDAYLRGVAAWMKCKGMVFTGDDRFSSWLNRAVSFAEKTIARYAFKPDDFVTGVHISTPFGVWDTVGSMGVPLYVKGERRDVFRFVDLKLSPLVDHGYHAMALDERRIDFPVTRWESDPRAEEVWFVGAHADVGGGYPATESRLSDIALDWMTAKLAGLGVTFTSPPTYVPNLDGARDFHKPWEKPPFNLNPRAREPSRGRDVFHASVGEYWQGNTGYQALWPDGFDRT